MSKTKWQIWAHLLSTPYSITALQKITNYLRGKGIMDIEWFNFHTPTILKEDCSMSTFMSWYKNDSSDCELYPELSKTIERLYGWRIACAKSEAAFEIRELYKENKL